MNNYLKFNLIIWVMILGIPLSFLGSSYILKFNGNFYPEPFILLWIIFSYLLYKPQFIKSSTFIRKKSFILLLLTIIFITIVGLLRYDADVLEYYARLRALLLFFISLYISYYFQRTKQYEVFLDVLFWISLSVLCLNFTHMLLATYSPSYMNLSTKITVAILVYPISIMLLLRRKKVMFAFIILLLLFITATMTFFRQYYIVFILSFLYFIFYGYLSNNDTLKKKINVLFSFILFLLFLGLFGNLIFEIVNNFLFSTESRYIHSIAKINDLLVFLNGGAVSTSEGNRLDGFKYLIDNMLVYLLPNGLINDKTFLLYSIWGGDEIQLNNVSIIRDSLFSYLIVCFGFVIVFLLTVVLNIWAIHFLLYRRRRIEIGSILFFIIFWFLFFLDGTLLTQFEKAFFTGVLFSFAFPNFIKYKG